MTGIEFYNYLKEIYTSDKAGKKLDDKYYFKKWLNKKDKPDSFQFGGNIPPKSVPQKWLIDSKEAKNRKEIIDRKWFKKYNGQRDCRVTVAIWLIKNHNCETK